MKIDGFYGNRKEKKTFYRSIRGDKKTIYSVPGFGIRLVYMQNHHNKQAKPSPSQNFDRINAIF